MSASERDGKIDYIEFPAASASDLQRARQFYAELFGWRYRDWGDDYTETKDSGTGCGVNADAAHRPAAPMPVVHVDDLEATMLKVQQAGGRISRDILSFPGGRRFQFIDPAGNELAVWSER